MIKYFSVRLWTPSTFYNDFLYLTSMRQWKFKTLLPSSIKRVKPDFLVKTKFSVKLIITDELKRVIKSIPNEKAVGVVYLVNIMKQCDFRYTELKDCIKNAFETEKFPDCFKMANVTYVHKKDKPTDKENYRPRIVSPWKINLWTT